MNARLLALDSHPHRGRRPPATVSFGRRNIPNNEGDIFLSIEVS